MKFTIILPILAVVFASAAPVPHRNQDRSLLKPRQLVPAALDMVGGVVDDVGNMVGGLMGGGDGGVAGAVL